jgi:hypothetical protein
MTRTLLAALAACVAMSATAADISTLVALAANWAEAQSEQSLARGVPLTAAQQALAREVGVSDPSRVRVHVVEKLPAPRDAALVAAAGSIGLMPQAADGMTLGYAVLIKRGAEGDARLLRHELRHVAQYESRGGIRPFFAEHIPALLRFGYGGSPFERDARAHELRQAR